MQRVRPVGPVVAIDAGRGPRAHGLWERQGQDRAREFLLVDDARGRARRRRDRRGRPGDDQDHRRGHRDDARDRRRRREGVGREDRARLGTHRRERSRPTTRTRTSPSRTTSPRSRARSKRVTWPRPRRRPTRSPRPPTRTWGRIRGDETRIARARSSRLGHSCCSVCGQPRRRRPLPARVAQRLRPLVTLRFVSSTLSASRSTARSR